ncbi:MAG: hypothetical protein AAFX44_19295 [Pseudomonadota bacterium]
MQVLKIADLSFPVQSANLVGGLADPYWCDTYNEGKDKELSWYLEVSASELEVRDDYWSPTLTVDSFQFPTRDWRQLEGQEYTWDRRQDELTGRSFGTFYVFEHADIGKGRLRFTKREDTQFLVSWSGLCDINFDDTYGTDVEFSLSAMPTFSGIIVSGCEHDSLETLRGRLDEHLNVDDFDQGDLEVSQYPYESGVGMVSCRFTPSNSQD